MRYVPGGFAHLNDKIVPSYGRKVSPSFFSLPHAGARRGTAGGHTGRLTETDPGTTLSPILFLPTEYKSATQLSSCAVSERLWGASLLGQCRWARGGRLADRGTCAMPPSRKLVVTDPDQVAALRRRGIKDPGADPVIAMSRARLQKELANENQKLQVSGLVGKVLHKDLELQDLQKEIGILEEGVQEYQDQIDLLLDKKNDIRKGMVKDEAWCAKFRTLIGPFEAKYEECKAEVKVSFDHAKGKYHESLQKLVDDFGFHPAFKRYAFASERPSHPESLLRGLFVPRPFRACKTGGSTSFETESHALGAQNRDDGSRRGARPHVLQGASSIHSAMPRRASQRHYRRMTHANAKRLRCVYALVVRASQLDTYAARAKYAAVCGGVPCRARARMVRGAATMGATCGACVIDSSV